MGYSLTARGAASPRAPHQLSPQLTCCATELHCQGLLEALLAKRRVASGAGEHRKERSQSAAGFTSPSMAGRQGNIVPDPGSAAHESDA